jgi:hypothetical protein
MLAYGEFSMVVAVRKIKMKPWEYILFRTQDGYLLSVTCGTSGMYQLNIPLTKEEEGQCLASDSAIDELAAKIRYEPSRYAERKVEIEEGG